MLKLNGLFCLPWFLQKSQSNLITEYFVFYIISKHNLDGKTLFIIYFPCLGKKGNIFSLYNDKSKKNGALQKYNILLLTRNE